MPLFSSKAVILSIMITMIFFEFEIYSSVVMKDDVIRSKRAIKLKSCIGVWSECRKNSSCQASYRMVKKKCMADANVCHAGSHFLTQCAIEIGLLQNTAFKGGCSCSNINYSDVKKIMKCTDIHNSIFANPCYDHGQAVFEEERLLGAVTMRTSVTGETDDVTQNYDSKHSVDSSMAKSGDDETTARPDDVNANDVATKSNVEVTTPKPKHKFDNHRQIDQDYTLTEDDFKKLDDLFAMDYYERYNDQKQPNIKTSYKEKGPNNFKNSDSNDKRVSNTTKYKDESQSYANDRNRTPGNRTSISTTENYFDDDNRNVEEHKSLSTDAHAFHDVTQAAYNVTHGAKDSDANVDFYDTEGKMEETILTTDQLAHYQLNADTNGDELQQQLSSLQIAFIVIGSLLLVVAILGIVLFNKKRKRNQYLPGMLFKKSCQSAIIVKVVYEDNDIKLKKKTDHV